MPRIAGVVTEKNAKGEITFVTINVKKHEAAIMPLLVKMGVVEKSKSKQELKKEKWLTVEEARKLSLKHLDELWKK
jgi:hypothetical protein